MTNLYRKSPVRFTPAPRRVETRDNWQVALEYDNEGSSPHLIDLSHRLRLDIQDSDLSAYKPFGITIPEIPGRSVLENGILINRMNRTQASVIHLDGEALSVPQEPAYTDVTESTVFLALTGGPVFSIAEKLSALDFMDPEKQTPFLFQGPFSHVPCQIMTLSRDASTSGFAFTCSRGYAKDMVHAVLEAGKEFGLTPAGEDAFSAWIRQID